MPLIYRKGFLLHCQASRFQSLLTLEKTAYTALPALLQTGSARQTVPGDTKSHNLQGTFVFLYCYLPAIVEVTSETLPKAGDELQNKLLVVLCQKTAASLPGRSRQRYPLECNTQFGEKALLQKLSYWLQKSM